MGYRAAGTDLAVQTPEPRAVARSGKAPHSGFRIGVGRSPGSFRSTAPSLLLQAPSLLPLWYPGLHPRWRPSVPRLQAFAQALEGDGPVPMLAPLIPGDRTCAGRQVDEPHPALGGVLVLSPWSSCSEHLDTALAEQGLVVVRDGEGVGLGLAHGLRGSVSRLLQAMAHPLKSGYSWARSTPRGGAAPVSTRWLDDLRPD